MIIQRGRMEGDERTGTTRRHHGLLYHRCLVRHACFQCYRHREKGVGCTVNSGRAAYSFLQLRHEILARLHSTRNKRMDRCPAIRWPCSRTCPVNRSTLLAGMVAFAVTPLLDVHEKWAKKKSFSPISVGNSAIGLRLSFWSCLICLKLLLLWCLV